MSTFALAHRGREASATGHDAHDHHLVRAIRSGDDRAFEELFERYHQRITAFVARIVGCRDHAEEIAQEAFISALRRLRSCDQDIVFRPWIHGIARNAAIDHLRATARRATTVDLDLLGDGLEPPPAPGCAAPEVVVERKQALADLRGAFGGLSDSHHEIIVLRELEGLSYDQIGERLGMTRGQVESTLFRARRRLEHEYEELTSGERCRQVQARIGDPPHFLAPREQRRLERHLAQCGVCRRAARPAPALVAA